MFSFDEKIEALRLLKLCEESGEAFISTTMMNTSIITRAWSSMGWCRGGNESRFEVGEGNIGVFDANELALICAFIFTYTE